MIKTVNTTHTNIEQMLICYRGNQTAVAEVLNVSRGTLHKLIKTRADNVVLIVPNIDGGNDYKLLK